MQTIHQTYAIAAPLDEVWKALTDPTYIDGWGGGPVTMAATVGTRFSLWGGEIHGTTIEVVPQEKLVQEWYSGAWDRPSIATFALSGDGDSATIDFVHTDVPDGDAADIEQGWKDYYLGPLKAYLEEQ